jgi:hypothetical protein
MFNLLNYFIANNMEYYKPKDKEIEYQPSLHDPFTTPKIIIITQKCILYIYWNEILFFFFFS